MPLHQVTTCRLAPALVVALAVVVVGVLSWWWLAVVIDFAVVSLFAVVSRLVVVVASVHQVPLVLFQGESRAGYHLPDRHCPHFVLLACCCDPWM